MSVIASYHAPCKEPSTEHHFTFGLPFSLGQDDQCPVYPGGVSLADSIPNCHTNVALISDAGVCNTRTLYRFLYQHPGGEEFQATLLEKSAECPEAVVVAVIGVNARAVRPIPSRHDESPVPRNVESRVRRLLDPPEGEGQERYKEVGIELSTTSPKVLKVDHVTMLRFGLNDVGELKNKGPGVICVNDQLFRLEGWCTQNHRFFSVYEKLHLSYTCFCCGCGEVIFYVYDLSGKTPKIVYQNGKFSD
jgi:hypothetical protein